MRPNSKGKIKKIIKKYQIYPLKRLGQNFLINKKAIREIIRAADLKSNDIVLEIGPGLGVLTYELAKRVRMVIAVERDKRVIEILKDLLKSWNAVDIKIIYDDILKFKISSLNFKNNYKLVSNLPFYLTAPVIRKFLESKKPPKEMVLVVQKEVGERICAKSKKMSILAVSVQFYAQAKFVSYISKKSFWPQPKVDSAIIKIKPILPKSYNRSFFARIKNRGLFFRIVKAGFSQPRKQLINNLAKGLKIEREKVKKWLLKNNIQTNQRAETLSIKDWEELTKNYKLFIR